MSDVRVRKVVGVHELASAPRALSSPIAPALPFTAIWRIWRNGDPQEAWVVDARWGRTIVDRSGTMLTCWHAGPSAGDLARRYFKVEP